MLTLLHLQFYYKIKINMIMMIIIIHFILQNNEVWPVNMQGAYNNKSVERSLYKKYYIIMIKICDKI